ncbi:hypothetical protein OC834_007973, partial [Tilletia horrida]
MPTVRCICFSRCRREQSQPERFVSVSTRDRHREEDRNILEARAYDGDRAPALLLDALINNHFPPVERRIERDVLLQGVMEVGSGGGGHSHGLGGAGGPGPGGGDGEAGTGGTLSTQTSSTAAGSAQGAVGGGEAHQDYEENVRHVGESLLERLLGRPPTAAPPPLPTEPPLAATTTSADGFRVSFYAAWRQSGATERTFRDLSAVLRAEGLDAGTIHRTRQLVRDLSGLQPVEYHMCRQACLAFT